VKTCPVCGEPNSNRARFCQACGNSLPREEGAHEVRKTVTVVFADVEGSTRLGERLDPESLRRVMGRFFEAMATVLERHGGSVEKFIGDAVMAVFGVPVLHEDDALRAVRAAVEMRAALRSLNEDLTQTHRVRLAVRTGVNTGEVVTGDLVVGHGLVTGDAVNVAARLEQTAQPGEILIGEATYRLVRHAVVAEPTGPVSLRGKDEHVAAYRLRELLETDLRTAQGLRSPMVGRSGELMLLRQAVELSAGEGACYAFTVLGAAGVGKSRLAEEALSALRDRSTGLGGRCLPYGDGITFWPFREVVWAACGIDADAPPDEARAAIAEHVRDQEHADRIVEGVAHLIGLPGAAGTPEETFWGLRRFVEVTAASHPLVVVLDDIHWAEPGLLDLVEYLADFATGPILLLCLARGDLLDVRPSWGAGRGNAMTISLSPLTPAESGTLIQNLLEADLDPRLRGYIAEASEGNPFFIEEIVRLLVDEGVVYREDGRWTAALDGTALDVPPTISALLSARLERLDAAERSVVQRASVVGKTFYWGAVAALSPEAERGEVGRQLQSLVRKELIAPEASPFSGEDAFRFRHILIRDAAYSAIPKESRADLHERLAEWIEERVADRAPEFEEIIGHHLEQAYRYRRELGATVRTVDSVARRAAGRLASSGRRALDRGDVPAAVNLLSRAVALLGPGDPDRIRVVPDLAQALTDHGELDEASEVLGEALAADLPEISAHAQLLQLWLRLYREPEGATRQIRDAVEHLLPLFRDRGDERGMARTALLLVDVDWMAARYGAAEEGLKAVAAHAARIGDRRQEMVALTRMAAAVLYGPRSVEDALRRCAEIRDRAVGDRRVEAGLLQTEAQLAAMAGRFDGVRETIDRAVAILEDLGLSLLAHSGLEVLGVVEMLAGDFLAAEAALRGAYERLERMRERGWLSTVGAELSRAIYAQGRYEEAERYANLSEELGASDDIATRVPSRGVRAKVAARRGEVERAQTLARQTVDLAMATDAPDLRGDAHLDLAEVLRLSGRTEEARATLEAAIQEFEAKGNVVSAARARALRGDVAETRRP
jgi:class 3 adenylate cyclase/tetratricopeptide (TPR) repeat protein